MVSFTKKKNHSSKIITQEYIKTDEPVFNLKYLMIKHRDLSSFAWEKTLACKKHMAFYDSGGEKGQGGSAH